MLLNRARAEEYMRLGGVDVLVATSPVNIQYFTDYFSWTDSLFKEYMMSPGASSQLSQNFAVLPLEGDPALLIGPLLAVNANDLWVRDVHLFGDSGLDQSVQPTSLPEAARRLYDMHRHAPTAATATDALLEVLRDRGLSGARIGLEMEGLTPKARHALEGALPGAQIKDCTNLIRLVRAVKSQEEILIMTRAAEINEIVGMECLNMARPGRRATELVQHYRARAAEMGADFDHFAYGPWGMGIGMQTEYEFAEGDIHYVDFGCLYQHYFSDTGTTLAIGEPSAEMSRRHAALRACVAAAVEAGKPGTPVSTLPTIMMQTLNDNGLSISFPHGHGLGLEIRDYPILVPNNGLRLRDDCIDVPSDLPLEVDMIYNLEAAFFMPGVGAVHLEKSFRVTPEGSQPLVAQDRSGPVRPSAMDGA